MHQTTTTFEVIQLDDSGAPLIRRAAFEPDGDRVECVNYDHTPPRREIVPRAASETEAHLVQIAHQRAVDHAADLRFRDGCFFEVVQITTAVVWSPFRTRPEVRR